MTCTDREAVTVPGVQPDSSAATPMTCAGGPYWASDLRKHPIRVVHCCSLLVGVGKSGTEPEPNEEKMTMFERFTDRARRVVVVAQEEARLLKHNYIGTEHLLLGLVADTESMAGRTLTFLDVTLDAARKAVEDKVGVGQQIPSGHIPFTPRAKKVMDLGLREALELGHNWIGTEHLLLGLVRQGEGAGATVLAGLVGDLAKVREDMLRRLVGAQGKETTTGRPISVTVADLLSGRAIMVDPADVAVVRRAYDDGVIGYIVRTPEDAPLGDQP